MKKRLLMLWTFLLCMVGGMSAEEVMLDFTSTDEITAMGFALPAVGAGTDITSSFTYKNITITPYIGGTTNVRIWNSNGNYSLRYYKDGGAIEIAAPDGNKLTQIVITGDSQLANTTVDKGTATMSNGNKTLTWAPSTDATETQVKFTNGGGKTTVVNTITVTYEASGVTPPAVAAPTITSEIPDFGPATVTVAGPEGAELFYSLNDGEFTVYSTPFTVQTTTTVKAYAKIGEDQSSTISKVITVNPIVATVAEMNALAKGTNFRFDGDAIVAANQVVETTSGGNPSYRSYVYIKDATASSLIYVNGKATTFEKGNKLTAQWAGTVTDFSGLFEVIPTTDLTAVEGSAETVTYDEVTEADITAANVNKVVTLKGVTYTAPSGKNFTIGTGVAGYNQFGIEIAAPVEGETYDMVGAISIHGTTAQFQPFSITKVAKVLPVTVDATAGDLTAQLNAKKAEITTAGDKVGDITINLAADAAYTVSESIEAPAGLVINGNGATIDASAVETPFVSMSAEPTAEYINNFYRVNAVKIANATIKGVKGSLFYDSNKPYCVVDFTLDNSVVELATTAVSNEAIIAFQAGGVKDLTINKSTVYGNAVAKYFVRYNNNARIDRFGFAEATDTWSMTYTNNTFNKVIKADGQWGNYGGVASKAGQMIMTIKDNIWVDCTAQLMRRLTHSKPFTNFNTASAMSNNTFWNTTTNSTDDQQSYGNGTDLITNPSFVDAANADFHVGVGTQQAKYKTGDPRWAVEYDATQAVPVPVVISPATESDITTALAAAKATVDKVGDITINLAASGAYTVSGSIEAPAGLVINGNGATIDASAVESPFILMSAEPTAELINNFYRVNAVKIANATIKGVKNSLFYDNEKAYCVVDFTLDNSVVELATTAVSNEAIISFKTGGVKDLTINKSTVYGNATTAKYFVRYNNNARIDRFGFTEATDTWSMTYTNNTFNKVIKADGQWGNYGGVASKAGQMIMTIKDNIWVDCTAQLMRRLTHSKPFTNFNTASAMSNNTFWNTTTNSTDDQQSYGNGTDLVTNPSFVDAANADFHIGASTQQAKFKTGDPRWLVEYSAPTLDKTALENEIETATTLLGDDPAAEGTPGADLKAAIDAAKAALEKAEFQEEIDAALAALKAAEEAYKKASGIVNIGADADADKGAWYNVNGVRVVKPTQKGLYIHNGKKVVIK